MITKASLFGLCFLSQAIALSAAPKSYYVAIDGKDSNPGAIDSPFLTPQHLVTVLQCGDTGYIRGGTYLGGMGVNPAYAKVCSSWDNSITVQNYNNETVIFADTDGAIGVMGFSSIYPNPSQPFF